MSAFDSAHEKVREAVKTVAPLSSNASLKEWAGLDDLRNVPTKEPLAAAWESDPTADVGTLQDVVGRFLAEVSNLGGPGTMSRDVLPALTDAAVRHALLAVRSLRKALEPPASKEQPSRIMLTSDLAEAVVKLAKYLEVLRRMPAR